MDDERTTLDAAKQAAKDTGNEEKLLPPEERETEASSEKTKGGEAAGDAFVDQAKRQGKSSP